MDTYSNGKEPILNVGVARNCLVGSSPTVSYLTGRNSVWSEYYTWSVVVVGSNPTVQTNIYGVTKK